MSVFQAALIALFYAFSRSAFNAGLGGYVLSQPLVAGTIAGLLLGDPLAGAALGGILNLSALALNNLRLRFGPDIALAGYVGIPLMLLSGITATMPQAIAVFGALAVFGLLLNYLRGVFNSVLAHWADYFGERGDPVVVAFIAVGPPQLWLFVVSFIPAFLLLRSDPKAVQAIAGAFPAWLQTALALSQSLLAALGIAMSLRVILRGSAAAYFVLGWLGAQVFGLAPVTLAGAGLAAIHAYVARKRMESGQDTLIADALPSAQAAAGAPGGRPRLTPIQLRTTFVLWLFFHDAALNFERFQNLGLAAALAPLTRTLCAGVSERAAYLRRQLSLFATEFVFGSMLVGAAAALEERGVAGDTLSDAEFIGAKAGAMAGVGAVGDAVLTSAITAFGVAVGASLARQQNLLGPFLFALYEAAFVIGLAYASFQFGYTRMGQAAAWARENDWLRAGLFGAVRLGAFMLGALTFVLAPMQLPASAAIQIDDARIVLQAGVLDRILPNALPLAAVLLMWWLMRRHNANPMLILGACLLLSFAGCGLMRLVGWL